MNFNAFKDKILGFAHLDLKKAALPICTYIQLIPERGMIMNNLDNQVEKKFNYQGPHLCIEYKPLHDLIKNIKASTIDIEGNTDMVKVIIDKGLMTEITSTMIPQPIDDFPKMNDVICNQKQIIPCSSISKAVTIMKCCVKDQLRPIMGNVYFGKYTVATDANILVFIKTAEEDANKYDHIDTSKYEIISQEAISLLNNVECNTNVVVMRSLNPDKPKEVEINTQAEYFLPYEKSERTEEMIALARQRAMEILKWGTTVKYIFGDTVITAHKPMEYYPNFLAVIPTDNPKKCNVMKKSLSEIIKIAKKHKIITVKLIFNQLNQNITVLIEDADKGISMQRVIPAVIDYQHSCGNTFVIGFNTDKLEKTLSLSILPEKLNIEMSEPNRAIIINKEVLLMPVMISGNE